MTDTTTRIARAGEIITFSHCECCGREVDPSNTDEGYTHCCNELVSYPGRDFMNRPIRCNDERPGHCYHD